MDSNTPYWPETLPAPLEDFSFVPERRPLVTVMETGRVRQRRQHPLIRETYGFRWILSKEQFLDFRSFVDTLLEGMTTSFMMWWEEEFKEFYFARPFNFHFEGGHFHVSAFLRIAEPPSVPSVGPQPGDACAVVLLTLQGAGDTFDCYMSQDPVTASLIYGTGWAEGSEWELKTSYLGVQAHDPFENYAEGETYLDDAASGYGWIELWSVRSSYASIKAQDSFDDAVDFPLMGGDGWSTGWDF